MRLFIILLLSVRCLLANDMYEIRLLESVLGSLFEVKKIKVYADADAKTLLQRSEKFEIIDKCNKNVLLLVGSNFQNLPEVCQKKPLFAMSYKNYKKDENAFGAFYWRKGRPQLKFKKERIKKFHLTLPDKLKKYLR